MAFTSPPLVLRSLHGYGIPGEGGGLFKLPPNPEVAFKLLWGPVKTSHWEAVEAAFSWFLQ